MTVPEGTPRRARPPPPAPARGALRVRRARSARLHTLAGRRVGVSLCTASRAPGHQRTARSQDRPPADNRVPAWCRRRFPLCWMLSPTDGKRSPSPVTPAHSSLVTASSLSQEPLLSLPTPRPTEGPAVPPRATRRPVTLSSVQRTLFKRTCQHDALYNYFMGIYL